jgi:1-phosphatidylinositol-4-phosphate 5-kinase
LNRWANGCQYEGEFKSGVYDGVGTFTWQDKATYKGNWKDGKRHGSGIYTSADGSYMYDGDWQSDVKHGQGFQQLSDGRTFEGAYTNGLPGSGVLTLQGAACACCHG